MRTGMKSAVQTGALGAIVATVGAVLSFAIMYQLTALNRNNANSTFRGFSCGAAPNREAVSRIRTFVCEGGPAPQTTAPNRSRARVLQEPATSARRLSAQSQSPGLQRASRW